jgi:EAL domain-containing protein (putative c-di-GMP-specific phosphodiesterase class I)
MTPADAKPLPVLLQPMIDTHSGLAFAWQARVSEPDSGDALQRERARYEAAIGAAVERGVFRSDGLLAIPLTPCGDSNRQIGALFRAALLHKVPTQRLLLEIRVDSRSDMEAAADLVDACMLRGMEVALDGFAATPAAMRLLARATPRFVKLDTALTRNIDRSMPRQLIAESVLRLSRHRGFTVIVQDVATPGELSVLYALGVCHVQSPWIAPAPAKPQDGADQLAGPRPRPSPRHTRGNRRLIRQDRLPPSHLPATLRRPGEGKLPWHASHRPCWPH